MSATRGLRSRSRRPAATPHKARALPLPRPRQLPLLRLAPPSLWSSLPSILSVFSLLKARRADRAFDETFDAQLEGVVGVGNLLHRREDLVALIVLERTFVELQRVVDKPLPRL